MHISEARLENIRGFQDTRESPYSSVGQVDSLKFGQI
jgi:hypothetical protein